MSLGVAAQAQTEIEVENYIFLKPLNSESDTITKFRIRCVGV